MRQSSLFMLLLACTSTETPTIGSKCTAEGTARCEDTTSQLLACQMGAFVLYSDCRGPNGCSVSGDTASCDTSGNTVGDRCPATSEGKVRCDPDGGRLILRCIDGGLSSIFTCPTGSHCDVTDAGLSCY